MLNRIYTIGHSTRTLDELVALLRDHGVTRLADVRRYPGSRRHPQFSREALEQTLPSHGIFYEHFDALGGRRKPAKHSPNGAWENEQFQGYADHMSTPEFQAAVDRLLDPAPTEGAERGAQGAVEPAHADISCTPPTASRALVQPPTAVMCAEAVPWRCHRNLLADELVRRGIEVLHILGPASSQPHTLSKMARIDGGGVIYPPEQKTMFD